MNKSTFQFLAALRHQNWFTQLGKVPSGAGVRAISTSKNALESLLSEDWSNFKLMLKNRSAATVNVADYARFEQWNDTAALVRVEFENAIAPHVKRASRDNGLPDSVAVQVSWDVLLTALEIEYSDLLAIRFYRDRIWPWYENGNLPCGWEGPSIDEKWAAASAAPVPEGNLLVY